MLEEVLEHLAAGRTGVALTLWHRHLYEFRQEVDGECVLQVLEVVPQLDSGELCEWIPSGILSDMVKLWPACLEDIARWGDRRVKAYEVRTRFIYCYLMYPHRMC